MTRDDSKDRSRAPGRLVGIPSYTLEEGRQRLHEFAKRARRLSTPSGSLLDRARSIGAYGRGGLVLVPEIDAIAAVERFSRLEQERDELLDEIEDVGIALLAQERLAGSTPPGELIPLDELARELGREHLVAD